MPKRNSSRKTITFRLEANLLDRIRQLVREEAGRPLYLTLTNFAEAAFEAHLSALRKQVPRDPTIPTKGRRIRPEDNHAHL